MKRQVLVRVDPICTFITFNPHLTGVNTELLDTLLCPEAEMRGSVSDTSEAKTQDEPTATSSGSTDGSRTSTPSKKRQLANFNALLLSKLMAIANSSCKPGERLAELRDSVTTCYLAVSE